MTLTEAKATDFQDSRDYVDFLQSKLQGVNIKIVKQNIFRTYNQYFVVLNIKRDASYEINL